MNLLDLPPELFEFIAKYLNLKHLFAFRACSRYCRELAEREIAKLTYFCAGHGESRCNPELFKTVSEMCKDLRSISLKSLDWLTNEMLIKLFNNNKDLITVQLELLKCITIPGLLPLLSCKKLISLSLLGVLCDDKFLQMFSGTHNQMLEIDIHSGFTPLGRSRPFSTPQGIAVFIGQQPHLQVLAIEHTDEEILNAICRVCKDLKILHLSEYTGGYEDKLRAVADNCPQLEFLILPCAKISVTTYRYFAQKTKVHILDNLDELGIDNYLRIAYWSK